MTQSDSLLKSLSFKTCSEGTANHECVFITSHTHTHALSFHVRGFRGSSACWRVRSLRAPWCEKSATNLRSYSSCVTRVSFTAINTHLHTHTNSLRSSMPLLVEAECSSEGEDAKTCNAFHVFLSFFLSLGEFFSLSLRRQKQKPVFRPGRRTMCVPSFRAQFGALNSADTEINSGCTRTCH